MKTARNPRQNLLAQIHIARKQLGLSEPEYRDLLVAATGKNTSSIMSPAELGLVIEAMVKAGFKPVFKGAPRASDPKSGDRFSGGSDAQEVKKSARKVVRLIFGLWSELGARGIVENGSREALLAFVKRQTGIDHPDWLDNKQASSVVEALKAMLNRARAS